MAVRAVGAPSADLCQILSAWEEATERLRKTHEVLREEVRRLTAELEAKNRQLARRERLAYLGQMAGHVAHEIRNALVPLKLYLSRLRREVAGQDRASALMERFESAFEDLEATVNDLLQFASDRRPDCSGIRVAELVEDVVSGVERQLEARGIRTEVDVPADLVCHADRRWLGRALQNLVLNAIDAMDGGGELSVTACSSPSGIEIEVADSGPGLDPEVLARLGEPFLTTKRTGTGLGLALAARVAEAHGGRLLAVNCPQGGAALTIQIPHPVPGTERRAA